MKLTLKKIGNSVGVILPKEVLARLHLEAGDEVTLGEGPGQLTLQRHDPEVQRQIDIGLEIIRERKDILKALAS
jgi:putative addiction module antidote